MCRIVTVAMILALASLGFAQTELLTNTSFDDPPLANGSGCGDEDFQAVTGWEDLSKRNGSFFVGYFCDGNGHASTDIWGSGSNTFYQNVSGLVADQPYLLTGTWCAGNQGASLTVYAELHNGLDATDESSKFAETSLTLDRKAPVMYYWVPFSVLGAPSGTDMTVVFRIDNTAGSGGSEQGAAMHVDNVSLMETTCAASVTVTDVEFPAVARDSIVDDMTITGTGFVEMTVGDEMTVWLEGDGKPLIYATDVKFVDTEHLTCDFDLTGELTGMRSVMVEVTGCGANGLGDAINIINTQPFANGSFELGDGTASTGCPVTESGAPWFWHYTEAGEWGWADAFYRNETVDYVPTCNPLPDGNYYFSSRSDTSAYGATHTLYYTMGATSGTTYTFSGWIAGGGDNRVFFEILNGDETADVLSSFVVRSGSAPYDWTFGAVSAEVTNTVMTVRVRTEVRGAGPHAIHADAMAVEVCTNPITLSGVTPSWKVNDGVVAISNLAGTGFDDTAGAPTVMLTRNGQTRLADAVNVVSPGQITCEFDLTGLYSGKYDIIVLQDGCVGQLDDQFFVVAADFANGSFEDPTAPANCGGDTWGLPTGWNGNDNLHRDGSTDIPSCDPLPDGIHYGSMHSGTTNFQQAWQTLSVVPGSTYAFSGQFAGGGVNTTIIKLVDGFDPENFSNIIAEETVWSNSVSEPPQGYPWTEKSVAGAAVSEVMTVVWEMSGSGSGAHADALAFAPTLLCHDPFADVDEDGDVDQEDFAVLQVCFTGAPPSNSPIPVDPAYCSCLNTNPLVDDAIDQVDVAAFEACASGPDIPANISCDD